MGKGNPKYIEAFSIPKIKTCPECEGLGFVTSPRYSTLGQNTFITRWQITCPKCKGKGVIFEEKKGGDVMREGKSLSSPYYRQIRVVGRQEKGKGESMFRKRKPQIIEVYPNIPFKVWCNGDVMVFKDTLDVPLFSKLLKNGKLIFRPKSSRGSWKNKRRRK